MKKRNLIVGAIVIYILDVLTYGSIMGIIYVLYYGSENLFSNGQNNLSQMYLIGVVSYIIFDSITSKFKIHYNEAKEYIREGN